MCDAGLHTWPSPFSTCSQVQTVFHGHKRGSYSAVCHDATLFFFNNKPLEFHSAGGAISHQWIITRLLIVCWGFSCSTVSGDATDLLLTVAERRRDTKLPGKFKLTDRRGVDVAVDLLRFYQHMKGSLQYQHSTLSPTFSASCHRLDSSTLLPSFPRLRLLSYPPTSYLPPLTLSSCSSHWHWRIKFRFKAS